MNNIYGVLINGIHYDTSLTEKGAKQYATRNGYSTVTVRYNGSCNPIEISHKYTGIWKTINNKYFNIKFNIGKSKYVINYHNGEKLHNDGSPFFDIAIFKNKVLFTNYANELLKQGYYLQ